MSAFERRGPETSLWCRRRRAGVDFVEFDHLTLLAWCEENGSDDQDHQGYKLRYYAGTHQFLRQVWVAAAEHIEQARKEDEGDHAQGDENKNADGLHVLESFSVNV